MWKNFAIFKATNQRRSLFLAVLLLCALLLALSLSGGGRVSDVAAAAIQTIERYVISGGGGYAESDDGTYAVNAVIGQPIVGSAASGNTEVCSGFWCGAAAAGSRIYLPLVQR